MPPDRDVVWAANLDDSEVLAALRRIDANMERLADQGTKHFTRVGNSTVFLSKQLSEIQAELIRINRDTARMADQGSKGFSQVGEGAKVSGFQIGFVSGIVQELTRRFIDLGERAFQALIRIAGGGVQLNKDLELTEIALTNVLGGNQEAAEAFLETTRQTARRLRTDYVELAQLAATILPQSNDIEQTNKLLEQAVVLGKQAGQNAAGIRIALQEALAGQFISLQRRLNVPATAIERIKELSQEMGLVNALVVVLGDRVKELGIDLESTADTAAAAFATLEAEGRRFQQILGEPVLEELKDQANALLDVLDEKGPALEHVATAFGQLLADVIEFIGTNIIDNLKSLDFAKLKRTADSLAGLLDTVQLLADVVFRTSFNDQFIDDTNTMVDNLNQALLTAAQLIALIQTGLAGIQRLIDVAVEVPTPFTPGADPRKFFEAAQRLREEGAFSQDEFNNILEDTVKLFDEYNNRLKENAERTRERHEEAEGDTDAALEQAQAYLEQQQRLKELAEAEAKAGEARKKINEELEEAAREREEKLTDIQIKQERERLKEIERSAQERTDIARKNAQAIEDIFRKQNDALEDAATDLTRKEEDIARRHNRKRQDLERELAQERARIEEDSLAEIQRIRERFELDAQEAERRNDAQAFLQAQRQAEREIAQVEEERQREVDAARDRAKDQRAALKAELAREIEDAQIANTRKLEDLQTRLDRELEAQEIKHQRELEQQAIQEERRRAQREESNRQELEDFARNEERKHQKLLGSLGAEFEAIREFERRKRELRIAEARRTLEELEELEERFNRVAGGGDDDDAPASSLGRRARRPRARRRHQGGPVNAGEPFLALPGETLVIPPADGFVIPNQALFRPPPPLPGGGTTINNQRTLSIGEIGLREGDLLSPVQRQLVVNLVNQQIAQLLD